MTLKKKYFYFLIYFVTVIFIYDGFTNTYIVIKQNYESRMINNAGNCNAQGFGFYKSILDHYSENIKNISSVNGGDFPRPDGYFFDFRKKNQKMK